MGSKNRVAVPAGTRRWGEGDRDKTVGRGAVVAVNCQDPPSLPLDHLFSYHLFLFQFNVPCHVLELVMFHVYVLDIFDGSQSTLVYFQVSGLAQRRTWIPIENHRKTN